MASKLWGLSIGGFSKKVKVAPVGFIDLNVFIIFVTIQ